MPKITVLAVLKEFRDFCREHGYMPALAPQPGQPDYAWKDATLFRKHQELERRIAEHSKKR